MQQFVTVRKTAYRDIAIFPTRKIKYPYHISTVFPAQVQLSRVPSRSSLLSDTNGHAQAGMLEDRGRRCVISSSKQDSVFPVLSSMQYQLFTSSADPSFQAFNAPWVFPRPDGIFLTDDPQKLVLAEKMAYLPIVLGMCAAFFWIYHNRLSERQLQGRRRTKALFLRCPRSI